MQVTVPGYTMECQLEWCQTFFSILGQKDIVRIIYFVLLEYIPGTQSNIYVSQSFIV